MQKLSDKGEILDKQAFLHPLSSVYESKARNDTSAITRAMQASYLESNQFAGSTNSTSDNLARLGMGITDQTEGYKYTFDIIDKS